MEFSSLLGLDPFVPLGYGRWLDAAHAEIARFGLVAVRFSGLMIFGPLFGPTGIPFNVRALLALALAVMITPVLPRHAARGFDQLDQNRDGWLTIEEVPPGLQQRFQAVALAAHRRPEAGLRRDEYAALSPAPLPRTWTGYVVVAGGELLLGLVLGLGAYVVLSGLQIAGQIIDQQAGFSLGEVLNPDFDGSGSVTGQSLMLLGTTLFLLLGPFGGHLLLLKALLQTFETLPVGEAFVSLSALELVAGLVQEAFLLGVRVAAPLVVMMTLIDVTLGFLGHSVPQVNIQAVGFATRAGLCLFVLVSLLSGTGEAVAEALPGALAAVRDALVFPAESW
jgi:flagellar biosynthetic protein FliR